MLLKGQCYTSQQVNGLSHIFTLALQRTLRLLWSQRDFFYSVIYVLIGREDGLCLSLDLLWTQFMQSPVILLHVRMMEHSVDFNHWLNQNRNQIWINPTGVLLKNMTPFEVMDISFYQCFQSCLQDPTEFKMSSLSAGEPLKQKSDNKFNLWPLAFFEALSYQKQVHRTNAELSVDPCFVFEKHIGNLPFLLYARWSCMQDPPHLWAFNGAETLSDC